MKSAFVAGLLGLALITTCFINPPPSPEDRVKIHFIQSFKDFSDGISKLKEAAAANGSESDLRKHFLSSRLAYKKVEAIFEYYFELDAPKFNGPPIDFVEEEDPDAYHQPQGLQYIEALLYPAYDTSAKVELLTYLDMLGSLSKAISENALEGFEPQGHVLEALTEETYRIIALGITGFDTPASGSAIPEASASLESIEKMLQFYNEQKSPLSEKAVRLANAARQYLQKNSDEKVFNRMQFIRDFMNPLSTSIAELRKSRGEALNAFRYSLILPEGNLFAEKSFRKDAYLFDDTITSARVALGKKLFSEPLLSATGTRSCASCHQPDKAFTDALPKALEIDGHTILPRNTPTLLNAAFQHNLFYDSRQVSLDQLINEVLGNAREMHSGPDSAFSKLRNSSVYTALYRKAYPAEKGAIRAKLAVNAISMYLRTLVSYNSRFDKYMRGNNQALSKREIDGFNLFAGKARCATCHFIPLLNGSKPPGFFYQESEVLGVPATSDTLHPVLDADPGRFDRLQKDFLRHAFKTPGLRNITLTAPYMHNGVFPDLKSVLQFYNKGGGAGLNIAPENQTLAPDPLNLCEREIDDIIIFLQSLSDTISYRCPPQNMR